MIDNKTDDVNQNNILALNMMFQFLFQELKDTKAVRRYIIRKMTLEFKELLNNKTASKLSKINVDILFVRVVAKREDSTFFTIAKNVRFISWYKLYRFKFGPLMRLITKWLIFG